MGIRTLNYLGREYYIYLIKKSDLNKIEDYFKTASDYATSNEEKDLLDFIKDLTTEKIISNDKSIINPYELDIYIPSKNLAFEFDGIYYHSNQFKDKMYHYNKTKLCEEKGIRLIHVFEDDWRFKQNIVKSMIKSSLGIYDRKIFARKCEIKNILVSEYRNFMNENHLQGYIFREIGIGIDYGSVNATTFVQIALVYDKKESKWKLIRLEIYYHDTREEKDSPTTEYYSKQLRLFLLYLKQRYPHVPITTCVIDSEATHYHNRLIADNIPHTLATKGAGSVNEGVQHLQSLIYKGYYYVYKSKSIKHINDDGIPIYSGKDEGIVEFESYRYDTIRSAKTGIDCYVKEFDHHLDACLIGDTIITTDKGNFKIIDLVGKNGNVKCFDGSKFIYRKLI